MKDNPVLFFLQSGDSVRRGDILWHVNPDWAGWYVKAEFAPDEGDDRVTVRSPNGAVPKVFISDLRKNPPKQYRCKMCGQVLPQGEVGRG